MGSFLRKDVLPSHVDLWERHRTHLNDALRQLPQQGAHACAAGKDLFCLLENLQRLPASLQQPIRFHGGGYLNHLFFWTILRPGGKAEPSAVVHEAISNSFGSFESFKSKFSQTALGITGSGWAWVVLSAVREPRGLSLVTTQDEDNPVMFASAPHESMPVLGLDMWEHAFYPQYENRKDKYVEAFWSAINWEIVSALYEAAFSVCAI